MEIYLIGHGGRLESDGECEVPPNVILHFYCPDKKKFDSSWEKAIRSGSGVDHKDFSHEPHVSGSRCKNYRLAHPGGIKSLVSYASLHPLKNPYYVGSNLRDQLNCAVKDRAGEWYVSLQDVLNSVKPNGSICHVHWFACRDDITGIEDDFAKEAKGMYGGIALESNSKAPAGKLDMNKYAGLSLFQKK
ncbi:putative adhesin [Microbulbifer epialgicus]|uniref:Adhesin n=1 Tax=Microbulbifer epialgicus TaxID=393907 RepID=A0ABV4NV10_9GAMM